jgi:hypothetical protein
MVRRAPISQDHFPSCSNAGPRGVRCAPARDAGPRRIEIRSRRFVAARLVRRGNGFAGDGIDKLVKAMTRAPVDLAEGDSLGADPIPLIYIWQWRRDDLNPICG